MVNAFRILVLVFIVQRGIAAYDAQTCDIEDHGTYVANTTCVLGPNGDPNNTLCSLVNCNNSITCCPCGPIDYSQSEWIPVSTTWYNGTIGCQGQGNCSCRPNVTNVNFDAACVPGLQQSFSCIKVPTRAGVLANRTCSQDSDCELADALNCCMFIAECPEGPCDGSTIVSVNKALLTWYQQGCDDRLCPLFGYRSVYQPGEALCSSGECVNSSEVLQVSFCLLVVVVLCQIGWLD